LLDPRAGLDADTEFPLEVGKAYVVFALTVYRGYVWYYLCNENYTYYPAWSPSPLFDVVEGTISRYWVYNHWHPRDEGGGYPIMAFDDWANDLYYYDRLTDGDEREVSIFRRYKRLIEEEADGGA
jgi:hypothetical protein